MMLQRIGLYCLSIVSTAACYCLFIALLPTSIIAIDLSILFAIIVASLVLVSMTAWYFIRSLMSVQADAKIICPPKNTTELWLVATIRRLAKESNISAPQIGICPTSFSTAIAVSTSRHKSLICVSRGLLFNFDEQEVEAVLAREVASISRGSNATMSLIQSVAIVTNLYWAYIAGKLLGKIRIKKRSYENVVQIFTATLFALTGSFCAIAIVCIYSRYRDFQVDVQAQTLVSTDKVRRSLTHLTSLKSRNKLPITMSPMCFAKNTLPRFFEFFSYHPSVAKRIRYIRQQNKTYQSAMDVPIKPSW